MEESVVIKRKRKWIEENKKRKYDGCDEDGRKETERVRQTCLGSFRSQHISSSFLP